MNKVSIIGTGPAGLTAAIYCARAGLAPVVYAGLQHGGQLTTTTEVENFPGFAEGILGPKLMAEMTGQAERVGARVIYEEITKVDFSKHPFRIWAGETPVETQAVIIATGATAKLLGLADEDKFMGRGLSTCATCDGFFYRDKKVIVVGGGDSAMEEAMYLANLCSEVILLHRSDNFRASKIMLERARKHPKVQFRTPFEINQLVGDAQGLKAVRLQHRETKAIEEVAIDGLFYAIGHRPNSEIFKDYVDRDDHGYIKVTQFVKTRTPGVFAAGDIADPTFKQAITAAGMGCQAAMTAARYLEGH